MELHMQQLDQIAIAYAPPKSGGAFESSISILVYMSNTTAEGC